MNDLISREAAINTVFSMLCKWDTEDPEDLKNMLLLAFQEMPSAQQWIPVSERLPIPNSVYEDVSVYYLVQNEYGDMMVATFVKYPGGARVWQQMYGDGAIMEDIVAWMPLPPPWRGEEG